jgi:ubiquinone/menaquinone biosynthesis C-methylase UbiE
MKNIFKDFFSQCARPEGFLGRVMLRFMNFGHAPLTNWGLGHVAFHDGITMADIGCGGGATLKRLLKRSQGSKVYGIDISEESVAKARNVNKQLLGNRVFVEQGSADRLPWDNQTFDVVTAVETVYFWPNLPKCFQEVKRVLKPGGQFAVMLEVIESDSAWPSVVKGMTVYSPEQLKDMLEQAGFSDVEVFRKKPSYATIKGILK